MTDVRISETAKDALTDLPPDVQERIKSKLLDEVVRDPDRYIKPLSGEPHGRIRVGAYRVVVEYDEATDELRIHEVGHRDGVYD